tara:strand:- start:26 stop:208 length:183 start_codon:yes stop_codon:yes gene_type:complete
VLRQIMSGKAEGIRNGRISAATDLGSQENDTGIRALRIKPTVIVPVTVNTRTDHRVCACR